MIHCGFTPSEVNYLLQFCLVYNDVSVCRESAVGVQTRGLFYDRWHSLLQMSHLNNSRNLAFVSVLGYIMAMWEAKETSMISGQEGGKKRFPWALQIPIRVAELVSSAFLDAEILRLYTDDNHGNVHDEHCLLQDKKLKKSSCLSFWFRGISLPPLRSLSSIRYVQRRSFQKSAGLKLLFSCLAICEPLPEPCLFARHAIPQQEGIVRPDWVRGCCVW